MKKLPSASRRERELPVHDGGRRHHADVGEEPRDQAGGRGVAGRPLPRRRPRRERQRRQRRRWRRRSWRRRCSGRQRQRRSRGLCDRPDCRAEPPAARAAGRLPRPTLARTAGAARRSRREPAAGAGAARRQRRAALLHLAGRDGLRPPRRARHAHDLGRVGRDRRHDRGREGADTEDALEARVRACLPDQGGGAAALRGLLQRRALAALPLRRLAHAGHQD
mmetsp:Transcript_45051/g.141732  ORF Transcript_45051/g.141732 Transcript_45051/m.141732 type:complete len:222 (-) Transcript_45051:50-715(-)